MAASVLNFIHHPLLSILLYHFGRLAPGPWSYRCFHARALRSPPNAGRMSKKMKSWALTPSLPGSCPAVDLAALPWSQEESGLETFASALIILDGFSPSIRRTSQLGQ